MRRTTILAAAVLVIDGDTIDLDGERIRFLGIDTPEIRGASCPEERKAGVAASERLTQLLEGREVEIYDRVARDHYGRIVARVKADGIDVGDRLVEEGYARRCGNGRCKDWCEFLKR